MAIKLSKILKKVLNEQPQAQPPVQQPAGTQQPAQAQQPVPKQPAQQPQRIKPVADRWDVKVTPKQLVIFSDAKNKVVGRYKALGSTTNTRNGIINPYDNNFYIYNMTPDSLAKTLGYKLNQASINYLISALNAISPEKKKFVDPDPPDISIEVIQNPENKNEYTFRRAVAKPDGEIETKDAVYEV